MPTTEQMLNVPFSLKINEKIKINVESLAPAWVTLILKRLSEYRSKKDKPFLQDLLAGATKDKKVNIDEIVDEIYTNAAENTLGLDSEETEDEELEIIRLMTIPNVEWKKTRGNFDGYEFKFSIADMKESFTELMLSAIWDEFWQRNPRFERKKKIMNPAGMAANL